MSETKKSSRAGRAVRKILWVWAYPVSAPLQQVRETTKAIKDMAAASSGDDGKPRNESFDDAIARRPAEAMPLSAMENAFRRFKNLAVFFMLASLAAGTSSLLIFFSIGGLIMSMALAALSFAFAFRFNLRLWQLRHKRLLPIGLYRKENPDWIKGCFKFE